MEKLLTEFENELAYFRAEIEKELEKPNSDQLDLEYLRGTEIAYMSVTRKMRNALREKV